MSDEAAREQGVALVEAGQYERALGVLGPYLAQHPDDQRALLAATRSLVLLRRPDEALRMLETAAHADPDSPVVLELRSWALSGLHRHPEAIQVARERCRRTPQDGEAWTDAALIELNAGRQGRSVREAAQRGVELDPQVARAHYALGRSELGHSRRRAAAAFRAALAIDPQHAAARAALARIRGTAAQINDDLVRLGEQPDDEARFRVLLLRLGRLAALPASLSLLVGLLMATLIFPQLHELREQLPVDDGTGFALNREVVGVTAGATLVLGALVLLADLARTLRGRSARLMRLARSQLRTELVVLGLGVAGAAALLAAGLVPEHPGRWAVAAIVLGAVGSVLGWARSRRIRDGAQRAGSGSR